MPLSRHGTAPTSLNANLLALYPRGDGAVQATVPLRAPPADVAAGSGSVWVAEPDAGLVARVDPARRAVAATIPVGTKPGRVVAAGGQVWVLDRDDRTLARIDPQTDTVAQTIALASQPSDVLLSAGTLWVASRADGTVLRIDPGTGRTKSVVSTGGNPSGLAASDGAVWVATDGSGSLARIDARTGTVTNTIRVGDAPAAVAAAASGLWVLDPLDATVARVDPRRNAVTATIALGGQPAALAESGGDIWIADQQDGTLLRLAPGHDVVTRFGLGGHLSALAAAGGGLWAAIDAAGASHRGGTLTAVYSEGNVNTIDPAAATSTNVPPPQFLGLTNDGLVTLNHVAGPDGTRLVPDLALALPAPTDHGRIYTFRLRPGIRYSTGALVRPGDVTRSFERLFQLGGAGAPSYQAISGAAACLKAPSTCDLSRGVAADDRAGTVTFHLTQPDPDFLSKLTLAYADVLPATTPGRQARTPLPATGPYMISRYTPGQELLMVRNPRFREWSAAAQPAGNPDRILIRLDLSGARGAAAVADGTSDFLPSIGQVSSGASYFQHHRSQLRINPQLITSFLSLNVNAPPFNDLRVRQAVNLALDRGRAVVGYGGPLAAQPTCQILPPGLAGYQRYCPYTRHPAADGSWHAPDLARARRLVAASGTAGMQVTVWDVLPSPQGAINEADDMVQALRQLGYRASLRLLPDSTFFAYTIDSRNHAQVIDGGWGADYASADNFIGKLACAYFVPGNGTRHHRRQRILRSRPGPADRPGRRPASHQPGRRRLPVGTARPETHRPGDLGSHRHPQRNRLPVQPGAQLPVQPGLGSPHRPVLDPVTPDSAGAGQQPGPGGRDPGLVGVQVPAEHAGDQQVGLRGGDDAGGVDEPGQVGARRQQPVVGQPGPEHPLRVPGLLAAFLPVPGDQRLDRGGLLGHAEQRPGALHDLPA